MRRALKLYLRGEHDRARRLLSEGAMLLGTPPPQPPTLRQALAVLAPASPLVPRLAEPADIIVPVYDGAAHLRRLLDTLFAHTDPRHRVLLADDCSSDPEVGALLALAATRSNVIVTRSDSNRGFVATVNAAMAATHGNAVILNSDTEVPPAWIDRLLRPIEQSGSIAATAPFSNAAQIFSVPTPDQDHDLPQDAGTLEIDRAFARLVPDGGYDLTAPATIGFCMAISRRAWVTLGPFDAATFGRGYCEETDWCLRAGAAGWSTRLVPDLFVFHKHGGSFLDRERKTLLEANLATLHRRWPDYYRALTRFRRRDPWAVFRAAAMLALATAPGQMRGVSIMQHRGGGPIQAELRVGHWRSNLLVETAAEAAGLQGAPQGL